MSSHTQNALLALVFATFYAGIYRLTQSSGLYHSLIDFNPWLFYPPAFIRLAAFLVIGFWSIPALFLAGLCCIDFGLSFGGIIIVSAFCAVGGPLGVDLAAKLIALRPNLENLTPHRLLMLSFGCAVGNAIFLKMGLSLADYETSKMPDYLSIVIGDTLGTWVMLYLAKIAIMIFGVSVAKR